MLDALSLSYLAFERAPSRGDALERMKILRRLVDRKHDGWLHALTERRVEQSFSERIFAEAFGYRTLFTHGRGDFELLPQNYHASSRRYDDFSLGFFGSGEIDGPRVLGEFKSPGTDLDAAQPGYEDRVSAVLQAFRAGDKSPTVRWLIVSNFDELRLYRNERGSVPQIIRLTEIDSVERFRKAHALLSRDTLLGCGDSSPLDLMYTTRSLQPMESRAGSVRLIHEGRMNASKEALIHKLDDSLTEALAGLPTEAGWPTRARGFPSGFELREDRIVTSDKTATHESMRIEFTKTGTLRVSELVDVGDLTAPDLATRLASFFVLAFHACKGAFGMSPAEYRWRLLDAESARIVAPPGWVYSDRQVEVQLPEGQSGAAATISDNAKPKNEKWLWHATRAAVRELLYPFVGIDGDRLVRVAPEDSVIAKVVGSRLPRPF